MRKLAIEPIKAGEVIGDFEPGVDTIDLTGLGAGIYRGTDAFSGIFGVVQFRWDAATSMLEGDVNNDNVADFALEVQGSFAGVATDLLIG